MEVENTLDDTAVFDDDASKLLRMTERWGGERIKRKEQAVVQINIGNHSFLSTSDPVSSHQQPDSSERIRQNLDLKRSQNKRPGKLRGSAESWLYLKYPPC